MSASLALVACCMALVLLSPAVRAAQPKSLGCMDLDNFLPPPGYSNTPAVPQNAHATGQPFTAGETLTLSVNTVTNPGVTTAALRDGANAVTVATLVLTDGASVSGTVPDGFTGLTLALSGGNPGPITNLTITCTAAPDPVDPSDPLESVEDVKTEPGQASQLVTVQTSALAVANFSGFIGSAVARRLVGGADVSEPGAVAESLDGADGAAGFSALPGGAAGTAPLQVASLLPVGQLLGAATSALGGGGYAQLAVAGAQLADNALAAADRPFGLWVNGAASFLDSDADGGQYSGNVLSLGGGADYAISDTLLVGLALGYERGDIDTAFNTGGLASSGFTAAPYVGWQPIPELVLDASIGVTLLDYEISRASDTIEGEYDATRGFAAINATGNFRFDRLRVSPLGGLLYFRERQEGYIDSAGTVVEGQTVDLGRLTAGLEAGYSFALGDGLALEPYARIEGELDIIQAGTVTLTTGESFRPGRYGGSVAGGLNLFSAGGFAGNIEASYDSIGRDSYDSVTVQGTLRFSF